MKPLLILALTLVVLPASAQEFDNRCWFASQSFTEGSSVNIGGAVSICLETGEWSALPAGGKASCLYNGAFYGLGAIVGVTNAPAVLLECQANGTWSSKE